MDFGFYPYRFYLDEYYLVAALVAGIWFYRMAQAAGKNKVAWAAGGAFACLVPNMAWRLFLHPVSANLWSVLDEVPFFALVLTLDCVGVALGTGFALRVYRKASSGSGGTGTSATAEFGMWHVVTAILVCFMISVLWGLYALFWVQSWLFQLPGLDSGLSGRIIVPFLAEGLGIALGLAVWYVTYNKCLRARGFPKAMLAIVSVALLYVFGISLVLAKMLEWGARPIPLIFFTGIVVLYIVAMRHALARNHGKATGYMIAAGILNLPVGIVALIVGIVARRAWKKSLQPQSVAQSEAGSARTESPTAPAD